MHIVRRCRQTFQRLPPQQSPYVYSIDELRRLLEATSVVHVNSTPLQAPMYRMLLILLYGSGLRIGEALNLTLRDVDVIERIITVRDTKFFKTRLVPIGPKLAAGTGCLYSAAARTSIAVGRRFSSLYNEDGPRMALSACDHACFKRSDEQPVSFAPPANVALRASTTFGTRPRSIELSRGIVPAGMSSVCCHGSRRISATSISNPPSAIST